MLFWRPGSGSGAARPPVSVAPAHSWRRARGAGLGAAGGRGTGAGGGSSWPLARGLGGWGGECKADVRSQDGPGSGRERRGGSARPGKDLLGRGNRGRGTQGRLGSPAPKDVALPRNKRLPQSSFRAPGNGVGSARGRAGETPPSDSSPGGTLGRQELGMGGGESLRKQTWRSPQPAQGAALPAPNFKKGRYLFKFTPTYRTPSTHTPS